MGWVTGRRQNAMLIKSSSSSTVGKDWRGFVVLTALRFSCPDFLQNPLLCPDLDLSRGEGTLWMYGSRDRVDI